MTDRDDKLIQELKNPKWSRYRDVAAQAARRIEELDDDRRYWQSAWQIAANRLLEIDPEVNSKTTLVDQIRKLEGDTEPRVIAEIKAQPNPWKDV